MRQSPPITKAQHIALLTGSILAFVAVAILAYVSTDRHIWQASLLLLFSICGFIVTVIIANTGMSILCAWLEKRDVSKRNLVQQEIAGQPSRVDNIASPNLRKWLILVLNTDPSIRDLLTAMASWETRKHITLKLMFKIYQGRDHYELLAATTRMWRFWTRSQRFENRRNQIRTVTDLQKSILSLTGSSCKPHNSDEGATSENLSETLTRLINDLARNTLRPTLVVIEMQDSISSKSSDLSGKQGLETDFTAVGLDIQLVRVVSEL